MDQKLEVVEEEDVVIVGGGICGLATALALHRKGIKSIVLERSESLRATGTAIGIHTNGWRALDQLGVGSNLRPKANAITRLRDVSLSNNGSQKEKQIETGEELRCMKRIDVTEVLANSLPPDTVRFGYHIVAVKLDPLTSHPLIQLQDGSFIKSKVVIGCDGVNSVISELLGLKPASLFSICVVRGFTNYPSGHGFSNTFIRMRKDRLILGRLPVTDNLVHWFVGRTCTTSDSRVSKDPEFIRHASIESIKDFPTEMIEMIKNCDLDSLTRTQLRYRTPWELLLGSFRKGTVMVAGDAMHVMGPFLGQGGSAALEDAVVLARNLASEMCTGESVVTGQQKMQERVGAAIDKYVKERRLRLFKLSTQAYLTGMLLQATSPLTKLMYVIALVLFFRNSLAHTRYDCGRL